jgi:hypothetical protein
VCHFADDTAGVVVSATSEVVCTEAGGTFVFSMALSSQPTFPVTVGVHSGNTTEGSLGSVSAITFTAGTWSAEQVVTVTCVDDDIADGNTSFAVVVAAAASTDPEYDGLDGDDISVVVVEGKFCVFLF